MWSCGVLVGSGSWQLPGQYGAATVGLGRSIHYVGRNEEKPACEWGMTREWHLRAGVWVGPSGGRTQPPTGWGQNNLAVAVSNHLSLFSPGQVRVLRPLAVSTMISLKAANIESGQYVYLQDLRELDKQSVCSAPISWPTCPTRLRMKNWVEYLSSYPDQSLHHSSMWAYPWGSG